jgi:hypothetical protein
MSGGLLSLDLAIRTGWCFGTAGSKPRWGAFSLGEVVDNDFGRIYAKLFQWLGDFVALEKPDRLVFEAPLPGPRQSSANAARILLGAATVTELVCQLNSIGCREVAVSTVRKHFCGNGNAKKADVMEACARRGWQVTDHNAADACALWDFACSVYYPGQASPGPMFARASA